jgi:hypothetical protein
LIFEYDYRRILDLGIENIGRTLCHWNGSQGSGDKIIKFSIQLFILVALQSDILFSQINNFFSGNLHFCFTLFCDQGELGFLVPADEIIQSGEEIWAFHQTMANSVIKAFYDKIPDEPKS